MNDMLILFAVPHPVLSGVLLAIARISSRPLGRGGRNVVLYIMLIMSAMRFEHSSRHSLSCF